VKIGIVGTGNVGCACAMAAVVRGSAREIVLVNRTRKTAEAVAADIQSGTPLGPKVDIIDGDYDALKGAGIVLITSGMNEKAGGASFLRLGEGFDQVVNSRHLSDLHRQHRNRSPINAGDRKTDTFALLLGGKNVEQR
jgi:lactate dehydrogenase-like 2-hydroxyacid dehydrogenase